MAYAAGLQPPRRGRGRPRKERAPSPPLFGEYNHMIDFSLTIASRGGHVPPVWLQSFADYGKEYSLRFSASLERGGRHENLHIQCVITFQCDTDKQTLEKLKKKIKEALGVRRGDGSSW